jgi:hypothetical protein
MFISDNQKSQAKLFVWEISTRKPSVEEDNGWHCRGYEGIVAKTEIG